VGEQLPRLTFSNPFLTLISSVEGCSGNSGTSSVMNSPDDFNRGEVCAVNVLPRERDNRGLVNAPSQSSTGTDTSTN
jgi:hypothetical protein